MRPIARPRKITKVISPRCRSPRTGERIKSLRAFSAAATKVLLEKEVAASENLEAQIRAGFEAGFRQGKEDAVRELLSKNQGFNRELLSSREEILNLAINVASELVTAQHQNDPSLILPLVDNALSHCLAARTCTLIVNPHNFIFLQKALNNFLGSLEIQISLSSDPNIPIGGARLETELGSIETSIEIQIAAIKNHYASAFST